MKTPSANVLMLVKGSLDALPPCVTHAIRLSEQGCDVTVAAGKCSDDLALLLSEHHVTVVQQPVNDGVSKLRRWVEFRSWAVNTVRSQRPDILWLGTGDTAVALYGATGQQPIVLCLLEMYDSVPAYRVVLSRIARRAAAVVVPEPNRGAILKMWWELDQDPVVVPNSPALHPGRTGPQPVAREDSVGPEVEKVVLYQGLLYRSERNVGQLASVVDELGPPYSLWLMGRDDEGYAAELARAHPSVRHVPMIPWPSHLSVTRRAWLGFASYEGWNLNTVFCAPNKIYEYAGFGVPILGDRVPGLLQTVERYNAGICVDIHDYDQVMDAIGNIESHYESFQQGALALYRDADTVAPIEHLLASVLRNSAY